MPGNASSAASRASRLSRSRWFVGSSSTRKFAPDATVTASASRRRSPPESTATGFSTSSQPEKRNRPSSDIASGRARFVIVCTHWSTEPRVSSSASCCEKYAGITPWPSWIFPFAASRRPSSVSSSVVLPEPFGPTRATCSPRSSANGRAAQQLPLADAQVEALHLEHRAPAPRRLQELEPERPRAAREQRDLVGRLLALALEPLDLRHLRLRLLRLVLLRAEPLDEALQPLDVAGDALRLLLRVQRARRLLAAPRVPRPGEERAASRDDLHRRRRDRLEEPAVVRDEDHRRVERLQLALEPLEARDVEVVRRLVQQQQVGVAAERARERRARQLAAREGAQRPVEALVCEAEAAHDRGRVVAPAVAARVLEPGLRLGVAVHRQLVVDAARHRLLELRQLLLEPDEVAARPRARTRAA